MKDKVRMQYKQLREGVLCSKFMLQLQAVGWVTGFEEASGKDFHVQQQGIDRAWTERKSSAVFREAQIGTGWHDERTTARRSCKAVLDEKAQETKMLKERKSASPV